MEVGIARESFDTLADQLPLGVVRTDACGRCLALNAHGEVLLGVPEDQALGAAWLDLLEETDRRYLLRQMEASSLSPRPITLDLRVPAADGSGRVLSCTLSMLHSADGVPDGRLLAFLDVTDRHRAVEHLRSRNRELGFRVRELECLFEMARTVERSGGDLGAIMNSTVDILARTWGGARPASVHIALEGQIWETTEYVRHPGARRAAIVVHGEQAGEIEIGRAPQVGRREGPLTGEAEPIRLDEETVPTLSEDARLLEVVAQRLGRTTERVRRRRSLREKEEAMRERLTHLTRVSTTGELASSIAHEVNQPLTAIATYAQACRRLVDTGDAGLSEVMEVLGRIGAEALRAGAIVHRLKDLVRRHETRWTECDLNALVRDLQQLASIDARLHDVGLRFELQPDLPPVLADGVQVQQVVLNLIRNGIDAVEEAAPPDPGVVVRTSMAGAREVLVSVADNGCGLAEELDRKLFQPFFTTKKGGMGMGLSISRSIALAHRGRVTFARNADRGMTFQLTLPVLDEI